MFPLVCVLHRLATVPLVLLAGSPLPALVAHAAHNALIYGFARSVLIEGPPCLSPFTAADVGGEVWQCWSADYSFSLASALLAGESGILFVMAYALAALIVHIATHRPAVDWFNMISERNNEKVSVSLLNSELIQQRSHIAVHALDNCSSTSDDGYSTKPADSCSGCQWKHRVSVSRSGFLSSIAGVPLIGGRDQGEIVIVRECVENDEYAPWS
jgi:hypothetical protein